MGLILITALLLTKAVLLKLSYIITSSKQNLVCEWNVSLSVATRIFIKSGKAIKYKSNKTMITTFIEWPRVK